MNIKKLITERIKKVCNDKLEYSKREMSRFTSVVLFLLLFSAVMFFILLLLNIQGKLSSSVVNIFWKNYMGFCKILITGYAVSFVASLGKSLFGKKEQEANKLTIQLKEKEIELEKIRSERTCNDV